MHAKLIDISIIIKGPNTVIEIHMFIRIIIMERLKPIHQPFVYW